MKTNSMDRRNFLAASAALAMTGASGRLLAAERDYAHPDLKLGVISDVHIRCPEDVKCVQEVLRWYRDQVVDGVIVAGDVADYGFTWQMDSFMGAWYDAFPGGKIARRRQKVELIYVTGNHEVEIWKHLHNPDFYPDLEDLKKRVFHLHIEREWERIFGEPYQPAFVKTIKGYNFFCLNYLDHNGPKSTAAVKELYTRQAAKIPKDRPFFHIQHCHPSGTCGIVEGKRDPLTDFLNTFPNLIAFSGDGHEPLDDRNSFWRDKFASVNTATLQHVYARAMKGDTGMYHKICNFPQGLLVRVWPDYVHIERRNFRDNFRPRLGMQYDIIFRPMASGEVHKGLTRMGKAPFLFSSANDKRAS